MALKRLHAFLGLLRGRPVPRPPAGQPGRTLERYAIRLEQIDQAGRLLAVRYRAEGLAPPPEVIFVDGFAGDRAIDLRAYWAEIQQSGVPRFETPICLRETIVKFGETQQLVDSYRLYIEVS